MVGSKPYNQHHDGLLRIIYYSRATDKTIASLPTMLDAISSAAAHYNQYNNVTGALLYCDGWFVQIIEGAVDKVDLTYRYIQSDNRHTNLHLVERAAIDYREFAVWNMTNLILKPEDKPDGMANFSPKQLSCEGFISLLHVVAQHNERVFIAQPTLLRLGSNPS